MARAEKRTHGAPLEQLDLAIADMDSPGEERRAEGVLHGLQGIRGVRIVERGVWISYNRAGISPEEILTALRSAGFRAGIFQESENGYTGRASF